MRTATVTADHVTRGVSLNCCLCPVALAIAEAVPGCRPWAESFTLRWGPAPWERCPCPEDVSRFILAFDNDELADAIVRGEIRLPLSFELPVREMAENGSAA